jgi:hypothetical protein
MGTSGVGETGLMLVRAGRSDKQHCSNKAWRRSNPKSSSALEQRGESEGPGGGEVEAQAVMGTLDQHRITFMLM